MHTPFYISLVAFWACLISLTNLQAQDPTFTQAYYNPIGLNPAHTGAQDGLRLITNHKRQWGRLPTAYYTAAMSADVAVPCYSLGVGVNAQYDVAGQGLLSTTKVGFSSAWNRPLIRRKLDIGAGFGIEYAQKKIDWDRLQFSNQLDPVLGLVRPTGANLPSQNGHGYVDVSAGISFKLMSTYGGTSYLSNFGLSVHHLNKPDDALISTAPLPRRFTLHAGSVLPLGRAWKKSGNMIFPYAVYNFQEIGGNQYALQREFSAGVIGLQKSIVYGVIFHDGKLPLYPKHIHQLGLLVGYQKPYNGTSAAWQINYSYDVALGNLSYTSIGTHEISLLIYIDGINPFCKGSAAIEGASKCFKNRRGGYMPQI